MEQPIQEWIIAETDDYMVLNKPSGVPVQADEDNRSSVLDLADEAFGAGLLLTHRLDQPTSGLMVLAKNASFQRYFQDQLAKRKVEKRYLGVVKKGLEMPIDFLEHWLRKKRSGNAVEVVQSSHAGAKLARMSYKTLLESDLYSLLEINLETGRLHQIRAQLAAIGFPVKGDVKYGFRRGNRDRSIHLHASKLTFIDQFQFEVSYSATPNEEDPLWGFFMRKMVTL